MRMQNYISTKKRDLFFEEYVFVDTTDHFFERVIKEYGLKIHRVRECVNAQIPYRLIACMVDKKNVALFENLIMGVRNNALLLGYKEYDKMCEKLLCCAEAISK